MDRFSLGGMVATLITTGDSWPSGAELNPGEKPYGQLVAEAMGWDFINLSEPGTGNDHSLWQIKRYVEHHACDDTIYLHTITGAHRWMHITDDNEILNIWPNQTTEQGPHSHAFYKYFHSTTMQKFRLHVNILATQALCIRKKIKDFYLVGWCQESLDSSTIDLDKFYDRAQTGIYHMLGLRPNQEVEAYSSNPYIKPNQSHPNQLGHKLIADKLIPWIQSRL